MRTFWVEVVIVVWIYAILSGVQKGPSMPSGWSWADFSEDLIAGAIVFVIGVPIAVYLAVFQVTRPVRHQSEREFQRFQSLAQEVRDDLSLLLARLEQCWQAVESGQPPPEVPPMQLLWDVGTDQLQFIFATYSVWRSTERAIRYYRRAMSILQEEQHPLSGPSLLVLRGTIPLLREAIGELERGAHLDPYVPRERE